MPENLQSLRVSAHKNGHKLIEVKPTEVSLLVSESSTKVLFRGKKFAPRVVLHRTVAKFMGICIPILNALEQQGSIIINDPSNSLKSRSKLESVLEFQRAKLPFLTTQFLHSSGGHELEVEGPIILKPINGVQGRGIMFFDSNSEALNWISTQPRDISPNWVEGFLVQKDLGKEVKDIRAYVVDGKCLAMMQRIPSPDCRLANIAQGGRGIPMKTEGRTAELAVSATKALGLDIAGVDLLETKEGIFVSEIDAWAGYAGIEKVTGVSISDAIIRLIEERFN